MADPRLRRVNKEIQDIKNDKYSKIEIALLSDSPFHLVGTFPGPEGSPYEKGLFDVDIQVPDSYPFQPLKMKFITKVYHPNISSASGAICLDILKDAWSPILTLKSTLLSLRSLLCSPEPNDPQDAEVAKHYLTDKSSWEQTARYWTDIYANGSESARPPELTGGAAGGADDDVKRAGLKKEHVEQFCGMGFERARVIETLKKLNYRGANVRNVSDDTVVNELIGG
ncbi:putative UBC1-E2 ubiquitin-conjugating enzyme [Microstroma glucosiphilum]|uniref:Ubiquitin-conjugating enzyme E2 1 n=1 Tax=Pseudomicrostroma glucosiphilum TaxID=1684307 RepID=A0A316U3M8_9BASI|nr:putative UBC1-E2 ubiquitin-conjugating enzyme [Pseudomicrostroma glucosiphilum]PWN19081.1 putative UBC1-E2 ubiquitin-conjugating enzyme [Pseudomicrostroma glucosiphilum]